MNITIICTGVPQQPVEGKYSSAGFDAAVLAERDSGILPYSGRQYDAAERTVFVGEEVISRSTAEQLILPCTPVVTPLANEIPLRSFADTEKLYPTETWLRKAAAQRRAGKPRQPESREAVIARADALIRKLEDAGGDSLLITYPIFLAELLDRFRVHNYVVQRGGLFRFQPLEKIVVSRKDEHCGGCQHNCFLSNPGCGVGRDKAMRRRS